MLELEIDGKTIEVKEGSTVMDAANKLGIFIPHFCYHKKLSIAANCRMCLVQVEKAPKPLPACATPVTAGMKVSTHSEMAIKAQKGVMEFLLINHPLDCPICDQGGECQLQDLAVGYGASESRYKELKRVVPNKFLGPLIATDMTRCIHCTRCVRFGQEVAGIMELGMAGRGEHSEIMPFIERTVNSELSGNMIDLCPVGALTSKPFRYTARPWELTRRKSISPHCGLGSNLVVQIKQNRVMRVLPYENESVNECWLSDKDRFSYLGLNADDRLTKPMLKQGGIWQEVEWQEALEYVANGLKQIRDTHGGDGIGVLASPHATLEELYLTQKLVRGLGSGNIDFRLRQSDFSADTSLQGAPWLGMSVAELSALDRVLVIGSFLRKDHPLLANRLRQAAKRGTQINVIHAVDDDWLMAVANKLIVAPNAMAHALAQVVKAIAQEKKAQIPAELSGALANVEVSESAKSIAASLVSGANTAILLGNMAQQHPSAAQLHMLAQTLAQFSGAKFGFLGEAANSVGAYIASAVPFEGAVAGRNALRMLSEPRKAYMLLNVEAELDTYDPQQTLKALQAAELVVAMSIYKDRSLEYADVILPIAPFTETSGTFINTEGRAQSFNGVVKPLGETRPAWKVLRVLGNLLGIDGFNYNSTEEIRSEVLGKDDAWRTKLNNELKAVKIQAINDGKTVAIQRIADVPIYHTDPIVRRSVALQNTVDAAAPIASMNSNLFARLQLVDGDSIRLIQNGGEAILYVEVDDVLPNNCIRVSAGHPLTAALGGMFAEVQLERVTAEQRKTG